MMRDEDITYLESEQGRCAVADNLARDPLEIALDGKVAHAAQVASQVKALQRARKKLPSYYGAGCILPPLAFEQASSEAAAAMKEYSGGLCIDLTCGLGVDSLHFSKSFERVVAIERSEALCRIARINFERLGAGNIEVVCSSAEDFLEKFKQALKFSDGTSISAGTRADLIYIDPDRRPYGEGSRQSSKHDPENIVTGRFPAHTLKHGVKRQLLLSDCSPDVVSLMPKLREAADVVLVKTSPLFDVDEAFHLFPACGVEVVSSGGECKEVLIELGGSGAGMLGASMADIGRVSYPHSSTRGDKIMDKTCEAASEHKQETSQTGSTMRPTFSPPYDHLIIPDVALRKARLTSRLFAELLPDAFVSAGDGYIFLNGDHLEQRCEIPGKVFEIVSMAPYNPKIQRKELAAKGITGADIYLHDFPRTAAQICKELGIREGGTTKLALARVDGGLWFMVIDN